MTRSKKVYEQWKTAHYKWQNIDDFSSAESLEDGIHTVTTGTGVDVDIFIRGNPFNSSTDSVLTFFGGAVSNRSSKSGPFLSGLGIAGQLDIPIIAIADPGVEEEKINIAWYTGGAGEKLQDGITAILDSIGARVGGELLLTGGSGGGFAALYYAQRVKTVCSVFVWNAQTDVFKYIDTFVRLYLNALFKYSNASLMDVDWITKTRTRVNFHADLSLLNSVYTSQPRRLFYLQNASDWHAQEHLQPYLVLNKFRWLEDGIYQSSLDHVCLVAHAAQGHQPPPLEIIKAVISLMIDPSVASIQVARNLMLLDPIKTSDFSTLPKLI